MPALAASGGVAQCLRCGRTLAAPAMAASLSQSLADMAECGVDLSAGPAAAAVQFDEQPQRGTSRSPAQSTVAQAEADDWLLDDELRRVQRRLNVPLSPQRTAAKAAIANHWPTETHSVVNITPAQRYPVKPVPDSSRRKPSAVAWAVLSLGLMAFMCGGVLLGWSLLGNRPDLWSLGMPIALVGQFGLLFGLVLQLDHLWQASRNTAQTLETVDERLVEINHATTLLQTTHSAPGQSFYAHLAENASPHLLLADLKGQLDLLAVKMSQR